MIICKICNPNLIGNGYCGEHSTSGTEYKINEMIKKPIIDNLARGRSPEDFNVVRCRGRSPEDFNVVRRSGRGAGE